jgi:hypothetical protein
MLLQALVTALFSLPRLTQQALVWQDFTPTDSSFAISVPTTPDVSVRYTRTAHGVLPTHSVSSTDTPRRQFFASWTTYPIDPVAGRSSVALLDAARNALIQAPFGSSLAG